MKNLLVVNSPNCRMNTITNQLRLLSLVDCLSETFSVTVLFTTPPIPQGDWLTTSPNFKFLSLDEPFQIDAAAPDRFTFHHDPDLLEKTRALKFFSKTKQNYYDIEIYLSSDLITLAQASNNKATALQIIDLSHIGNDINIKSLDVDFLKKIDAFDLLTCSQMDIFSATFGIIRAEKILPTPHTVDDRILQESLAHRSGVFDNPVNILTAGDNDQASADGVKWFLREVWPLAAPQNVSLNIYGGVCDLLDEETLTGDVRLHGQTDIRGFREAAGKADICVTPIFDGFRGHIQVIEYLGCGAPTVACSTAVRGLPFPDDPPLEVAASRRQFGEKLLYLIQNAERRRQLTLESIFYIQRHFSQQEVKDVARQLAELSELSPRYRT